MPGHAKPRAHGVLLHDQFVMIPAQSGAECEIAFADQVLDESRLLAVLPAIGKPERGRRVAIEDAQGSDAVRGNAVREALVNRAENGVRAGLPLVRAGVAGKGCPRVGLPKAAIL